LRPAVRPVHGATPITHGQAPDRLDGLPGQVGRLGIDLEIVQRDPTTRGFHVQPRRWVIERTLSWLMHHRRRPATTKPTPHRSAAMIQLAAINLMTRRLTHETTANWRDS
jgi:transposase